MFDFEQINLIPEMCQVGSRGECDTSVVFGKHKFRIPVVPANMECVINETLAQQLSQNGYFYILHRFGVDVVAFARKMKSHNLPISISLGVNPPDYEILKELEANSLFPDFVTIDIAHGHSVKMRDMLQWIRSTCKTQPFVIAGNVCTAKGARDLEMWGASAIKVGIGPGSACTTYNATGFGSRNMQASCILECSKAVKHALIIADGGIRVPGDIGKALVMGATMVMIGGMFSGLSDAPGNEVLVNGQAFKEFWGSASAASGKTSRIEGQKSLIPMERISYLEKLRYLEECLQSGISYAGGNDISAFRNVTYAVR